MKRTLLLLMTLAVVSGCTSMKSSWMRRSNPYDEAPFYTKYLQPGNDLDDQIQAALDALRLDPWNAPLHNTLGELLIVKGLPKWSEVEFRRAVASDKRFFPAWYNLGLMREARGNEAGAVRAFETTLEYKPGHAAAHFQLALIFERQGRTGAAIDHYAEAIRINRQLLSPVVNPRIVDAGLIDRALMKLYPRAHSEYSLIFEPTPKSYPAQPPQAIADEPVPVGAQSTESPAAPPAEPEGETTGAPMSTPSMSGAVYPPPGTGTGTSRQAITPPPTDEQTDPRWRRFMRNTKAKDANAEGAQQEEGTEAEGEPEPESEEEPNAEPETPPSPPNRR